MFTAFKTWVVGAVLPAADLNTYVRDNGNAMVPVGVVEAWPTAVAPTSWLLCQGQAVSRTTYSVLFGVIGTTYGAGDGSTTFNLPDLRGRVVAMVDGGAGRMTASNTLAAAAGEENHTLTTAETPAHTHTFPSTAGVGAGNGADIGGSAGASAPYAPNSIGGGGAHNTKPPYLVLNYIIFAGA